MQIDFNISEQSEQLKKPSFESNQTTKINKNDVKRRDDCSCCVPILICCALGSMHHVMCTYNKVTREN